MNEIAAPAIPQLLANLLRHRGVALLDDRRRLLGLLRDYAPEESLKIRLLMSAFDQGVPERLRQGPISEIELGREISNLIAQTGLAQVSASNAVRSWALALQGLVDPTQDNLAPVAASPVAAAAPPVQPLPASSPPPAPQALPPVQPLPPVQLLPQAPPQVRPLPAAATPAGAPPTPAADKSGGKSRLLSIFVAIVALLGIGQRMIGGGSQKPSSNPPLGAATRPAQVAM